MTRMFRKSGNRFSEKEHAQTKNDQVPTSSFTHFFMWLALAAPAGTPSPIVMRLYSALADGLKDPAFRSSLDSDGSEVVFNSPAEFAALLQTETAKWQALITRVGVKLE